MLAELGIYEIDAAHLADFELVDDMAAAWPAAELEAARASPRRPSSRAASVSAAGGNNR